MKQCKCLEQVQSQLKEHGMTLKTTMQMDFKTGTARIIGPLLATQNLNPKSKKAMRPVVVAYCPFCGKKMNYDRPAKTKAETKSKTKPVRNGTGKRKARETSPAKGKGGTSKRK